jgi:membrane protease YdiL (CAAX protease family)
MPRDRLAPWLAVLTLTLVAPICEEFFFRGILFAVLLALVFRPRSTPPADSAEAHAVGHITSAAPSQRALWLTILISAAYFSAMHLNTTKLLPAFLSGLIYAIVYARTHSLWAPILLHIGGNSLIAISPSVVQDFINMDLPLHIIFVLTLTPILVYLSHTMSPPTAPSPPQRPTP